MICLIQRVVFTTYIDEHLLHNFLRDLDFPDDLFKNLFDSDFLFLRPVGSDELLDKVVLVLRKLRTDEIIDTAFGFEGLDHFPFA